MLTWAPLANDLHMYGIDVCAVQLPGRMNRLQDEALTSVFDIVVQVMYVRISNPCCATVQPCRAGAAALGAVGQHNSDCVLRP
jgi:surfactin synthase thioesterase subunit